MPILKHYLPGVSATLVTCSEEQFTNWRGLHLVIEPLSIRSDLEDLLTRIERGGWAAVWLHCANEDIQHATITEIEKLALDLGAPVITSDTYEPGDFEERQ